MTQPKIPFIFLSPIPKFFKDKGFLKNPKNAAFILWCFERCSYEAREIIHDNQKITLQPYQFVFGRVTCSEETGLTEDEVRTQQKRYENLFYLKKAPNKTPSRFTIYEWSTELFCNINPQVNHQVTPKSPPSPPPQTRTREPIELKELTEQEGVSVVGSFSCLEGLGLSVPDVEKLMKYKVADVERAVQAMKESKKTIGSVMGFLISALTRKFQPKSAPNIEISELAKSNRDKLMHFRKQEESKLKIKDLDIKDFTDHAMFGPVRIPYEMEWPQFKELVMNTMERFNIIPRQIPKMAQVVEEGKIVHLQSAGAVGQGILEKLEIKK